MSAATRHGLLIILSSPSGAGKSTLAKRMMARHAQMSFSVSATTRPMRPGEIDGKDYHFKSHDTFREMIAAGEMLEYAEVFGNYYGSPKAPVEAAIQKGADVIFDVDWQGGQQIRASALRDHVVSIFILPPSIAALSERLHARGQDSADVVAYRMQRSRDEISHWEEYDYVLVNDDLERCAADLEAILHAERLRKERQQAALMHHVLSLNTEFEGRK